MCVWGHCPAQRWYFCFQSIIFHSILQIILQNLTVEIYIHLSINLASIPNPIPGETAPHHQRPSSKFECRLNKPSIQDLPGLFLHPFPSIWPQPIDFSLIRPNYPLPVIHSPVLMCNCKVQSLLLVMLWWKWSFCHQCRLHSSLFQVPPQSLDTKVLICDTLEGFTNLNSYICFARADVPNGMSDIRLWQLSRTASKRLRHVMSMMIHHHKYSTNVDSNSRGYLSDSLVRIKKGENVKSSRGRDGLHDGWMLNWTVYLVLFMFKYDIWSTIMVTWLVLDAQTTLNKDHGCQLQNCSNAIMLKMMI